MSRISPGNTIPTLTVGNRVVTDMANVIFLIASLSGNAGASRFSTFRRQNAQAGYQVPTGKVLTIIGLRAQVAANPTATYLGYGDNDVGYSAAANMANIVRIGLDGLIWTPSAAGVSPTPLDLAPTGMAFDVPAGKYVGLESGLAAMSSIWFAVGILSDA